jgi:endonuclease YncB( thermonuclease family)
MEISEENYKKLLAKIQQTISKTQENIVRNVNYQKVLMGWQIGKEIDSHLRGQNKAEYGKKLFLNLVKDTGINRPALYQMHAFFKAYPEMPSEKNSLSWSHYRSLIAVKDQNAREQLENLVVEKSLGSNRLEEEIAAVKKRKKLVKKPTKKSEEKTPQLKFKRGELFTYVLNEDGEIDLGFNIFLASDEKISALKKSDYTYVAKLERVVDGDTIHVKLDLGFGVKHHEILRLAKIDAAPADTKEGKKATEGLKKILKDVKFLIVKTNKTDTYGRYIADVFFDSRQSDPNKVAAEGQYLNQTLLDLGLVELY